MDRYLEVLDQMRRGVDYEKVTGTSEDDFGLARILRLVSDLSLSLNEVPTVHITGSVGKGTTALLIERLLEESQVTTATYLSPHLEDYTERIRRRGRDISRDDFTRWAEVVNQVARPGDTFFERLTAVGFAAAVDISPQVLICEVGLGGKSDATNVVAGEIALFTPICGEHRAVMGGSLADIVEEKGGIIKESTEVVIDGSGLETDSFERRAREVGARYLRAGVDFTWRREGEELVVEGPRSGSRQGLPFTGTAMAANGALAVMAVRELEAKYFGEVTWERTAWRDLVLPGRREVWPGTPTIIVDGGHTGPSACDLAEFLGEGEEKTALVIGLLADKDVSAILVPLLPLGKVVFTTPDNPRRRWAADLAQMARSLGGEGEVIDDPQEALARARELAGEKGRVVVTGSFTLAGTIRSHLRPSR